MVPTRLALGVLLSVSALLLAAPFFPAVVWVVAALDAALLLTIAAEGFALRRAARLSVLRILPDRLERGRQAAYTLEIENLSRLALAVEGAEMASSDLRPSPLRFSLELDGGERRMLEVPVLPGRRGLRRVGPSRLSVRRRLGLAESRLAVSAETLLVDPSFAPARQAALALKTARLGAAGVHRLRLLGEGKEFDRLRDYLPGDDMRHIDWRATARRRFPVTRLFRAEREQNVVVCLDTGRLMGRRDSRGTRLDTAVEAALALSFAAQRNGDQVGLLLFDDEVRFYLPPRRGPAHFRRLVEALARTEPRRAAADPRVLVETLRTRCRSRSLVVLVTDALDEEEGKRLVSALPALSPPHLALALFFREEELEAAARAAAGTPESALEALSARVFLEARRRMLAQLSRRGVQAAEVGRADLSATLVQRYLQIKSRQVL